MNTVEIPSQHIEFVFENCEAINVDVWAIETLNFDVSGERYTFDTHRKNLLKQIQLGSFYIKMDLSNPKHFYHTNRLKDNNITTEEDGEQCINRLKNSDDICHVYINEVCYHVPFDEGLYNAKIVGTNHTIQCMKNNIQVNEVKLSANGKETLIIKMEKSCSQTESSKQV